MLLRLKAYFIAAIHEPMENRLLEPAAGTGGPSQVWNRLLGPATKHSIMTTALCRTTALRNTALCRTTTVCRTTA